MPAARHLLLELLRAWDVPHDREDAALLVTELVANVVDHVGGEANLTLELSLSEDGCGSRSPTAPRCGPWSRSSRTSGPAAAGLRMVQAIADRWGAEDHHGGKRVWFELGPPAS